MREILFRGKRKDCDGWTFGSLIKVGAYCCILPDDSGEYYDYPYLDSDFGTIDGCAIPVIPETVGQFTGLKDALDRKIFEGDIVQGEKLCDIGCYPHWEVVKRTVTYDTDVCAFEPLDKMNFNGPIMIIGNIYNNPELLEGGVEK